jgi:hypothetical protein
MGTNKVARAEPGDTNLAAVIGVGYVHGCFYTRIAVTGPFFKIRMFHL